MLIEIIFKFDNALFLASTLFLKNPQRIMALMMIMVVSLLVHTLTQCRLRLALAASRQTIPNQKDITILGTVID